MRAPLTAKTGVRFPNALSGFTAGQATILHYANVTNNQAYSSPVVTSTGGAARAADNLWMPTFNAAGGFTLAAAGRLPTGQNVGDGNILFQWSPDRNLTPPYLTVYASLIANGTVNIVLSVHNGTTQVVNTVVGNAGAKGGAFRFSLSGAPGRPLRVKTNGGASAATFADPLLAAGAVQMQLGARLNGSAAWGAPLSAFALWNNDNFTDIEQLGLLAA